MIPVPFHSLDKNASAFENRFLAKVREIIASGQFLLGQETERFEDEFAHFCGTKYAIAVSSGTAALRLTLQALGIGKGDEVITAPNSYFATALAIRQVGARPVFVDVDPVTLNIDPERVAEAITSRTAAVITVHLYGRLSPVKELGALCARHSIPLIEDAAQAHGASREGRKAGSFGDAGCFSFHPVKNLGAFGDAGAVTTSNKSLAEKIRSLRNYGQAGRYFFAFLGNNDRCDELQAAILRLKLSFVEKYNQERRCIASQFNRAMPATVHPPSPPATDEEHVYHLYVGRSQYRQELIEYLRSYGIDCRIHYPTLLHEITVLNDGGKKHLPPLPHAKKAVTEIFSLPLYPELTQEQVGRVCSALSAFQPVTS